MGLDEINIWLSESIADPVQVDAAFQVLGWVKKRDLSSSIQGGEVAIAFPWLPGSDGWLAVSPLDSTVIVRFDRLRIDPPFGRPARNRLMKRIDHEGFVQRGDSGTFALVRLADLQEELELKALIWRLDQIYELAETAKH
jgi:hypothetical protein